MTTKHLRLEVSEDLHRQVKLEAVASGKTMHDWIVEAIAEKANKDGKQRHGNQN